MSASLTVVGTGIKILAQVTLEARAHIEKTERVLFLPDSNIVEGWIRRLNPQAESLASLYHKYPLRLDCYKEITQYIVTEVKKGQHVCVVLYGHPTVFALPALAAVQELKRENYPTWILPGVSAEDCLFADLCIDPATHGCQSFEATDFLLRKRNFDTRCHLILWQVGVIGCPHHPKNFDNRQGAAILATFLSKHYGEEHEVILYEAATLPHEKPRIDKVPLKALSEAHFSMLTTLYVPPLSKCEMDLEILGQLGLEASTNGSYKTTEKNS